MGRSWLDLRDAFLLPFCQNISTKVSATPAAYGVLAPQVAPQPPEPESPLKYGLFASESPPTNAKRPDRLGSHSARCGR
jgi:hypothetical protein